MASQKKSSLIFVIACSHHDSNPLQNYFFRTLGFLVKFSCCSLIVEWSVRCRSAPCAHVEEAVGVMSDVHLFGV